MLGSKEPDLRKYAELYARVEVPEILALAVLLHDTGKAELTRNHEEWARLTRPKWPGVSAFGKRIATDDLFSRPPHDTQCLCTKESG